MNTMSRWMLALAAIAVMGTAAGCGAKGDNANAANGKGAAADTALLAAADVAVAARADLSAGVPVSGPLAPGWRTRVTAPLEDVIQDVLVREGQKVSKGQALARFRMGAVEANAASARAALRSAQADFERQKNLLKEGAVSARDVEAAEAGYRAAAAQDELASRRLQDATVRAPGAGTVTVRSVQSGDRVGMGDPLFEVANTSSLEFEATVPSEFVSLIKVGAPVKLSVTGYAAGSVAGHVARINATADPATRQVQVYASVPNPGGKLVGDVYATGNILVERATNVLAVPSAAIHKDDAGSFAWIVDKDGRAARHVIQAGLSDQTADRVQVLSGLADGDRVIVGPIEGLTAGQPVHVAGKER
jgi:membrane fusion protein, multidrug efflux system